MTTKEKCLLYDRADRLFALSAALPTKKGINHDASFDTSCKRLQILVPSKTVWSYRTLIVINSKDRY